ncbi:hypothetical protein [Hyperthermus butylicus]|uniref:Uncharacterized protein n=1 Tax=Hyperthermus butylicus (strain DSM 5456 / JCM 9403 / PLM1-5) TaxID=415426 RepID=A2BJF6_HYPBU|nr:hypothetical protein [Hyperthermus butylicus]ABM80117.1 hypothetical protein Hbut_0245 [Hyperthermus butylicus DSM 5456]
MYTTIGPVVRISDASRFPLRAAIAQLLRMGNGRLVYKTPDGRIFQIDVSGDGRAGCIAIGARLLQGDECLQEFAKLLGAKRGTIELITLTPQLVNIDLQTWPKSILSDGVMALYKLIGAHPPAARPPAAPAAAGPSLQPAASPLRLTATPAAMPAKPAALEARISRLDLRDYFNPLTAVAIILRGERLTAQTTNRSCTDIVLEVAEIAGARIYTLCRGDRTVVQAVVENGRVQVVVERDDGTMLLGREALLEGVRIPARDAEIFVERG